MKNRFAVVDSVTDLDISWNRVEDRVYVGEAKGIITDGDVPCNVIEILIGEEANNNEREP